MQESAPHQAEQPSTVDPDRLSDLLVQLPAGTRMGIERLRPDRAKGWLTTIEIPEGATPDYLMESVRQDWGGGTFRLRVFNANGRFHGGGVTVSIAGEPLFQGRRYLPDGSIDNGASSWPQQQPQQQQWFPSPQGARVGPSVAEDPRVVTALSGLVQQLVGKETETARDVVNSKLGEVLDAIRQAQGAAPRVSPIEGLDAIKGAVSVLRELKGLASELHDDDDDDDAPAQPQQQMPPWMMPPGMPGMEGMPFGGMMPPMQMPKKFEDALPMLAWMWMQRQHQPQQQGQWVQGPQGTAIYVVSVQTPQGMQWVQAQPPQPQQQQPMGAWQQPAQQWGPPPQWAPPQAAPAPPQWAPPQAAPPQAPAAAPPPASTRRVDGLSARNVLDELARMDADQAAALFDEVGNNLPPHIQAALMRRVQQMPASTPQPEPAQPIGQVVSMHGGGRQGDPFVVAYHDPREE